MATSERVAAEIPAGTGLNGHREDSKAWFSESTGYSQVVLGTCQ